MQFQYSKAPCAEFDGLDVPLPSADELRPLLDLFRKSTAVYVTPAGSEFFGLRLTEDGRKFFKGVE